MDPFRLCLAFGPAAVYLLVLGAINLARRPLLVSGARDAAALALAVSGFVIVGPMELFYPDDAAAMFGAWVWVLLLSFYLLCVLLLLLVMRPRLVIYNISADQLRPILADVVDQLDADARWAGDNLALPSLGIQLHLESVATLRNLSLVASGPNQSYLGWRRLEAALHTALGREEFPARRARGLLLLNATVQMLTGAAIVGVLVWVIARDPQAVARSLLDMLRL